MSNSNRTVSESVAVPTGTFTANRLLDLFRDLTGFQFRLVQHRHDRAARLESSVVQILPIPLLHPFNTPIEAVAVERSLSRVCHIIDAPFYLKYSVIAARESKFDVRLNNPSPLR